VAATQDNGLGIDGINDDAPLWVSSAVEYGKWADALVAIVDTAIASNQLNAIINLSIDLTQVNPDGSVTTRYEFTPQERAAIEYARQSGVLIVAASGNDGGVMSVLGQASQEFDNIITVGAADGMARAEYSSYGYGLDIVAPGGTVENPVLSTTGESVGSMAGTSVATAKVTGAASQVWAANPELSYRQVIEILKETATDINTPGWDAETGAGLLNMAAAVGLAKTVTPVNYEIPTILIPETWSGEEPPEDEMSANARSAFEEAFGTFSNTEDEEIDEAGLENLTPEERQVYEEATRKVDQILSDYLGAASQKIALEYVDGYYGLQVDALGKFVSAFDENSGDVLIKAQEILGKAGLSADISTDKNLDLEGKIIPRERAVAVAVPTFSGRLMNAGYVTQTGWLRIRSGAGTNFSEVGRKYPGDYIAFDAYENNGSWVSHPFMPGGGSSRWYKIAGTDTWMSALYIDSTPEQAAQERQRQEAIRRAEEEASRAKEAVLRAEEEARRAAEELKRIEEEATRRQIEEMRRIAEEIQRKQEQLQSRVNEVTKKHGELGALLGSYVTDGVTVYQFARGVLLVQADLSYGFYEIAKNTFEENKELLLKQGIKYITVNNILKNHKNIVDNILSYKKIADLPGANGFVVLSPRIGDSKYVKFVKGANLIGLTFEALWTLGKAYLEPDSDKKREILIKGGFQIAGASIGAGLGSVAGGFLGGLAGTFTIPVIGTVSGAAVGAAAGSMAGGFLGGQMGGLIGDSINENWNSIITARDAVGQAISNAGNAVSSFTNNALDAAKAKAQAAVEKARELAEKATATYNTAKATVQQAQAAYQTFKQEVQKQTTQIVQQSQQLIKEEVKRIAQSVVQAAPKVFSYVANYAKKAVQVAGNIINGAKQFVGNIIQTGKQIIDNVINTGKRAYETVKTFVGNTYEAGKKVVTQTFNNAVNTVTNTFSGGFNQMKSLFGW